jgi:chemotaxis methyl-accepting protein methylase
VIPALWQRGDQPIRAWSAGCSSGEEPYSLAILIHRHAAEKKQLGRLDSVSIAATDIDDECLGEADRAFYAEGALGETPSSLRESYFPVVAGLHTMIPPVRKMVTFSNRDLLQAPPPGRDLDLLVCRNVIIYFEREAQERLFEEFHSALAPGGYLVLGKVETLLGRARSLFTPVNARERVFRKA